MMVKSAQGIEWQDIDTLTRYLRSRHSQGRYDADKEKEAATYLVELLAQAVELTDALPTTHHKSTLNRLLDGDDGAAGVAEVVYEEVQKRWRQEMRRRMEDVYQEFEQWKNVAYEVTSYEDAVDYLEEVSEWMEKLDEDVDVTLSRSLIPPRPEFPYGAALVMTANGYKVGCPQEWNIETLQAWTKAWEQWRQEFGEAVTHAIDEGLENSNLGVEVE